MLDADLSELYGAVTRRLNEAVKRNAKRFPEDLIFQLSREESREVTDSIASTSRMHSRTGDCNALFCVQQ